MNVRINPEVWNSFSRVQKRAVAEGLQVERPPLFNDLGEVAAWVSTAGVAVAVATFALILL